MGNNVCSKFCHQKSNFVEFPIIEIKSKSITNKNNNYDKSDKELNLQKLIKNVTLIQKFLRIAKLRSKIKIEIKENKLLKKQTLKENQCEFKESWDIYFKSKTEIEFSINGLNRIKNEIKNFYNSFLKSENNFNRKNSTIIITEKKFNLISDVETFITEFRIPIIKQMAEKFNMGDLNFEYEKLNFTLERISLANFIEEYNTLENESSIIQENFQTSEDKEDNLGKSDKLEKDDNFYLEREPDLYGKSSTGTASIIKMYDNFIRKETYISDKSNISNNKTNFKTWNTNEQIGKISSESGKNNNKNLSGNIQNESLITKNKYESNKVTLLISSLEYEKPQDIFKLKNSEVKLNLKPVNKLEMENIIEKINQENNKNYISFFDKETLIFYQGSWHSEKLCKFGIGYLYMIDNNKGIRYKYYGYFRDDLYHGVGLYMNEEGYMYFGEFRFGMKCGFGIEIQKNNFIHYKGFFKNDKYHGYGEYINENKINYVGLFKNGNRDGIGFLCQNDGSIYTGFFKHNKMHGIGLFQWPTGHTYYGSWKEDKMNGLGRYQWIKGDIYTGHYENDFRHGQGEYRFSNNAVLSGIWRFSKKEGKFELKDGISRYVLHYRNDIQLD